MRGENMNLVQLRRFGLNLTGRPLGIQTLPIILKEYARPFDLDFSGVFSIGSSFADEVVAKLAEMNGGQIKIYNSTNVIKKCLRDVATEKMFDLEFLDTSNPQDKN
jgi:hypothetical protein